MALLTLNRPSLAQQLRVFACFIRSVVKPMNDSRKLAERASLRGLNLPRKVPSLRWRPQSFCNSSPLLHLGSFFSSGNYASCSRKPFHGFQLPPRIDMFPDNPVVAEFAVYKALHRK